LRLVHEGVTPAAARAPPSAGLVKPAEDPDDEQDRERNSEQPQQNEPSHSCTPGLAKCVAGATPMPGARFPTRASGNGIRRLRVPPGVGAGAVPIVFFSLSGARAVRAADARVAAVRGCCHHEPDVRKVRHAPRYEA
jgi:hypothetical protein